MVTTATATRESNARNGAMLPSATASTTSDVEPAAEPSDDDPLLELAETMDRSLHYLVSRFTLGLSPMAMGQAYFDWAIHLASSPGTRKAARLALHMARCAMGGTNEPCIAPLPHDKRFADEAWQSWPFSSSIRISCCSSSGGTTR